MTARVDSLGMPAEEVPVEAAQSASSQATAPAAGSTATAHSSSTPVRVSVTAKVKVEDRYVDRTLVLPKVTTGPQGIVIVGVIMDHGGDVTSARIQSGTTISDEDVLDACKEAALKTRFSINFDVSAKHPGTITYTFTAK